MSLFRKKVNVNAVSESDVKAVKQTKKTTPSAAKNKAAATPSNEGESKIATSVKNKISYRITEKATKMGDKNVFVLNVPKDTNKTELKKELVKKYKVTVLGINMVNSPKKAKNYRGRAGYKGGGKKAYVTVKKGETIVL